MLHTIQSLPYSCDFNRLRSASIPWGVAESSIAVMPSNRLADMWPANTTAFYTTVIAVDGKRDVI
jgi:hypothetical protein